LQLDALRNHTSRLTDDLEAVFANLHSDKLSSTHTIPSDASSSEHLSSQDLASLNGLASDLATHAAKAQELLAKLQQTVSEKENQIAILNQEHSAIQATLHGEIGDLTRDKQALNASLDAEKLKAATAALSIRKLLQPSNDSQTVVEAPKPEREASDVQNGEGAQAAEDESEPAASTKFMQADMNTLTDEEQALVSSLLSIRGSLFNTQSTLERTSVCQLAT
jgi:chromosome segregation ATPase